MPMTKKCDTCSIVAKALKGPSRTRGLKTHEARTDSRMTKSDYWAVGETYVGAGIYKAVSDYGVHYLDKKLNRANLPVEQQIRPWVDTLVAAVSAIAIGEDWVKLDSGMGMGVLGAGVAGVTQDIGTIEQATKSGVYAKRYTAVQAGAATGGRLAQTPIYKPAQRTGY